MDINKLNQAHELLDKSQAVQIIVDTLKNITQDTIVSDDSISNDFIKALFKIKVDLFERLLTMKADYDKEFAIL